MANLWPPHHGLRASEFAAPASPPAGLVGYRGPPAGDPFGYVRREITQTYPQMEHWLNTMEIVRGSGPGMAEVYRPGEQGNPVPSRYVIQIRKDNLSPSQERDVIITEAIQLMGRDDPDGDMQLKGLKRQYKDALTDEDLARARGQYDDAVERYRAAYKRDKKTTEGYNPKRVGFSDFLNRSFIDSEIRGIMFPNLVTDEQGNQDLTWDPELAHTTDQLDIAAKTNEYLKENRDFPNAKYGSYAF